MKVYKITGVAIQAGNWQDDSSSGTFGNWVTRYRVQYSDSNGPNDFVDYTLDGAVQVISITVVRPILMPSSRKFLSFYKARSRINPVFFEKKRNAKRELFVKQDTSSKYQVHCHFLLRYISLIRWVGRL